MEFYTAMNTAFEVEAAHPVFGFLPIGAVEQHSRHLPLLTDTLLADTLSAKIIEQVEYPGLAYLLPTLQVSSSEENAGFAGALSFTPFTLRAIVRDLYDSLQRSDIPRMVVCAWHGGNFILKPVIRELNHELNAPKILYLNPFEHLPAETLEQLRPCPPESFDHSSIWETSMMLALDPSWVRDDRRDNPMPFDARWLDLHSVKTLTNGEGHVGYPTYATAEIGQKYIDLLLKVGAEALETLLEVADRAERY